MAKERILYLWNELIREVQAQGVDGAVIACTDLSLLSTAAGQELNMIDSSEALAKSVVNRFLSY